MIEKVVHLRALGAIETPDRHRGGSARPRLGRLLSLTKNLRTLRGIRQLLGKVLDDASEPTGTPPPGLLDETVGQRPNRVHWNKRMADIRVDTDLGRTTETTRRRTARARGNGGPARRPADPPNIVRTGLCPDRTTNRRRHPLTAGRRHPARIPADMIEKVVHLRALGAIETPDRHRGGPARPRLGRLLGLTKNLRTLRGIRQLLGKVLDDASEPTGTPPPGLLDETVGQRPNRVHRNKRMTDIRVDTDLGRTTETTSDRGTGLRMRRDNNRRGAPLRGRRERERRILETPMRTLERLDTVKKTMHLRAL